ncbi:MAG: PmoA family protein, partial [Ignavibacteriae bacterium]|nr:PmoA family protein [Ignavibacteriota bacterium]
EDIALNELQSVRIYKPVNPDYYLVDVNLELNCGTENPVKLLKYRYGGFGLRATEKWNSQNSEVLTSDDKIRKDADGSRARWIMIQGDIDNDHAGIIIMSYPTNYNFPEPLRVWPEDQNGRGDVFVNFSPTKNTDWDLLPGNTYTLKYRLLVFNGKLNRIDAENAWQSFTTENNIKVIQ